MLPPGGHSVLRVFLYALLQSCFHRVEVYVGYLTRRKKKSKTKTKSNQVAIFLSVYINYL